MKIEHNRTTVFNLELNEAELIVLLEVLGSTSVASREDNSLLDAVGEKSFNHIYDQFSDALKAATREARIGNE